MTSSDPCARRAYQLYVIDGLSLRAVACIVHADRVRIRGWIVELGGVIRPPWYRSGAVRGKGRPKRACSIGVSTQGAHSIGDSWYCGRHCEHGNCDEEATVQDLAAFKRLEALREADAKLIAERKAKKLSGNALWRGVRGKWR